MVKLNGNIPNINLGLTVGLMSLMLFTIIVGGLYIDEVHKQQQKIEDQSQQNGKEIKQIKATLKDFIKDRNTAFNYTYSKLENISSMNQDVLQQQINNEENILGNLSRHRIVANDTNDRVFETQQQLHKENIMILKGLQQLGANVTLPENNVSKQQVVENTTEILNILKKLIKD